MKNTAYFRQTKRKNVLIIVKWDDLMRGEAWTEGSAVTIGVFDGVHRGHRALLDRITASPYRSVVVTFSVSPRQFFHQGSYSGDIVSLDRKLELFDETGIETCVLIDFSETFSRMTGGSFIGKLSRAVNMRYIVVGADFHCGYRNDTDAAAIKRLARASGIEAEVALPVMEGGLPVSSSRIRHALAMGEYGLAAALLGRGVERL
ncbi:MAG: FAD synthetase family protein [Spirochaetaceae bacterium]|jgi:FAD synthase|nr:FAD synthetase family protein [Spirochaetaceae bacterium]